MQRMSKPFTADQSPAQARAKDWYDAQLKLISEDPQAAGAAFEDMKRYNDALRTAWELKVGSGDALRDVVVDIASVRGAPSVVPSAADETADHGLTRNQVSKVRAVYLLEALARDGSNHPLSELHAELRADGFKDEHGKDLTEAALRSHLFRMKEAGYVAIVSTGVYELTNAGFDYLKQERVAQKALVERFRGLSRG